MVASSNRTPPIPPPNATATDSTNLSTEALVVTKSDDRAVQMVLKFNMSINIYCNIDLLYKNKRPGLVMSAA